MTLAITWHPDAESELDAAIDWYDDREVGLGDRFEGEVLDAVAECADAPQAWAVWPGWEREPEVRSKGVSDFPYRVVYFVAGDLMTIVAVAHAQRRPGYWRERLPSA